VDLPTYTSIWRIEKRLYKLYDFRLPMPVPIGQISVFAAITLPYVVLLGALGLPFSHTLIWLYVLPPGVLTWLVTRPVLEGKRLPELIWSQARYLSEPRVWCRMAPLAERDTVTVTGRVWRLSPAYRVAAGDRATPPVRQPARAGAMAGAAGRAPARPAGAAAVAGRAARRPAAPGGPAAPARAPGAGAPASGAARAAGAASAPAPATASAARPATAGAARRPAAPAPPARPAPWPGTAGRPFPPAARPSRGSSSPDPSCPDARSRRVPPPRPAGGEPGRGEPGRGEPGRGEPRRGEPRRGGREGRRPAVTVIRSGTAPPPAVESVLAGPAGRLGAGRPERVTVVPGGYRPGRPDQLQRDRARAQLALPGPARVVVLGCTVGAGQTVTALLAGEVLVSLRPDSIAVLDLNPGELSLAVQARARPALSQAASLAASRLVILGPGAGVPGRAAGGEAGSGEREARLATTGGPAAAGWLAPVGPGAEAAVSAFEQAGREHRIVLADPSTTLVPRLLPAADQVILVAPASPAAPGAVGMTFEWLDANGRADLAAGAIMVFNGVSRRSLAHVEQAERLCAGQCRAIVRVPWDDQISVRPAAGPPAPAGRAPGMAASRRWAGLLAPATVAAYTALAGVLVHALARRPPEPR